MSSIPKAVEEAKKPDWANGDKTAHQVLVEAMMRAIRVCGKSSPLPSAPGIPSGSMILRQAKLIMEEVLELMEACGVGVHLKHSTYTDPSYLDRSLTRDDIYLTLDKPPTDASLPHIAKELADVQVVNTGMFSEFGISDSAILSEVNHNNLAKFSEGGYIDENGKWRKPPNHPSPDLEHVLRSQGWNPEKTDEESQSNIPV